MPNEDMLVRKLPLGSTLDWFIKHELKELVRKLCEAEMKKPCVLNTIFPAGPALEFPLDLIADEKEYVAYTIPNCGRMPTRHIMGDVVEVGPGKERLPNGEVSGELEADPCHIVCLGQTEGLK